MNKDLERFFKVWDKGMIGKHILVTGILGLFGPWGIVMGMIYAIGDGVGKSKEFTAEDEAKFWACYEKWFPRPTEEQIQRIKGYKR